MRSGVGLSEILLIMALIVVFVDSKQIPGLARKTFRAAGQMRAAVKKYMNEINR
jgi:Sec-independent protein translocase protein TatA